MLDVGVGILNIVMVITTMWIVNRFWGSFYEKKKRSIYILSAWVLLCTFQLISQNNNGDINIAMTIINTILIYIVAICGYKCKGKEKYFLLIIFCAVWALVEIFTFFLLNSIHINQENQQTIGIVISKLLMLILVYIVSMVWDKKYSEYKINNFYLYLLFIPIGSIFIAVNQFYSQSNKFLSAVAISILLLFNVVIFEIYIKMNEIFAYEKEKTVHAQQLDIMSYTILEQKKIMENFYEEKHNLINELIVLKGGIENGNKENAIKNLNKIINSCNYVETVSNSGNSTIDAIINFKYAIAKEYGIEVKLKIFIPEELPFQQNDLGIVIGNAIDNAIEAVKECKNKERFIEIAMGVKKEAWIMVIRNPYEHKIKRDRTGRILSTKKEEQGHGYGLKSIMRIADEYQGEVIMDDVNGIFSLSVILNFPEI